MLRRIYDWLAGLCDPFAPPARAEPPDGLRPFLAWILSDMRRPLAAAVGCALAIGFLEVALVAGIGGLADRAAASTPETFWADHGAYAVALLLAVAVLRPLAALGQGAFNSLVINPGLTPATLWRLHRHTLGQPLAFFEEDFAGRLAQKQMQAGAAAASIVIDVITALGMIVAFLIGMALVLGATDWRLAALTAAWGALFAFGLSRLLPTIRARAKARAEKRAQVTGQMVDSFTNIATVKLFPQAETAAEPGGREATAARESLAAYRESSLAFGRAVMALRIALNLLNATLMLSMLGLAYALWLQGAATPGVAVAAGMLTLRLTAMSNWIAFTALSVFNEIGTLEDAIGTLSKPHGVTDRPGASAPPAGVARIAFEGVGFRYGGGAGGVSDLSLTIEPGEKVGLVGPSGAGKSTLVRLLLRLHDVEEGAVRLNGLDVRDLTQDGLRAQIGVITQETAMFNRSALDNIRYGRPEASEADAIAAAKRAQAHEFIRSLRDGRGREGYQARLGERGVKLSGGQRQRIALARTLLKNAPILVLDEATSALDSDVEAAILETLYAEMRGKTVIAIAHRLSTIAEMDRIVAMEDGRIVESGAHAELLARGGLYARLWARQSGGFLQTAAE